MANKKNFSIPEAANFILRTPTLKEIFEQLPLGSLLLTSNILFLGSCFCS